MADSVLKQSILLRMVMIGVLSFFLLIPTVLTIHLVDEREHTRDSAVTEVSAKWGNAQTVAGPILTIPFSVPHKTKEGEIVYSTELAHVLPESLVISAAMTPEIRHRGMFEVVLYSSRIHFEGRFPELDLSQLGILPESVLWDKASLTVGLSDLRGIKDGITIQFAGQALPADPGVASSDVVSTGISVHPSLRPSARGLRFSTDVSLNGTGQLLFVPTGKETNVVITGGWGKPSFVGNVLPADRSVEGNAFSASWKVLHLNRNFPQQWTGRQFDVAPSAVGVRLLLPIDEYQKITRAAKYAIMFIVFTFLAFFLTEILSRKVIHPIQYGLIGLALLLFYVLLLSISEQLPFNAAYVISSVSIIILVAGYTRSVLSSNVATAMISGILVILYGFMYVLLQLEDYALLLGSIGLFVILALVMYLTRRIDWFAVGAKQQQA